MASGSPASARKELHPEADFSLRRVRDTTMEMRTLYAALDNIQSGLLMLDAGLRATYSNPALHRIFSHASPEFIRSVHPPYEQLLRDAASASAVDMEDYVDRRLAWVKSADSRPMDLRMSKGTVIRCRVVPLPDGGRMLTYSDVTDIVRAAEELERLATIDGMTGIYNRRHFMDLADHEWKRAKRHDSPISFLMIDIDHFKRINDTFGHQVGDAVIVHLAKLVSSCKRSCDVLARFGGEEFALLLPETDLSEAVLVAERLCSEAQRTRASGVPPGAAPTISVGVAVAKKDMADVSAIICAADQALYEAKRTGRNRVCLHAEA